MSVLNDEKLMRAELADKKLLEMTSGDWRQYNSAMECHICNESLLKPEFRDSFAVHDPNTGEYYGQSHKRCYY